MTKIKLNGAKTPHMVQLQEDPKRLLTKQAIDTLMTTEHPEAHNDQVSAFKAMLVTEEKKPRRIYTSSISNTLTHAGVFIATATNCGPQYATSNPLYALSNLQSMRDDAYMLVTNVDAAETGYKYAVANRKQEFYGLSVLCALVIAEMVISGASRETVDQMRTLVRKLRGQRKVPKNPNSPSATYNSVSQMNYDNLVANFERLIMMVTGYPNYDPVVDALKVLSLETKLTALSTANNDVMVAWAELDAARMARNQFFNATGTGLVAVFVTAKNVVLTNFGRKSEQYKQVSGLEFRKIRV